MSLTDHAWECPAPAAGCKRKWHKRGSTWTAAVRVAKMTARREVRRREVRRRGVRRREVRSGSVRRARKPAAGEGKMMMRA